MRRAMKRLTLCGWLASFGVGSAGADSAPRAKLQQYSAAVHIHSSFSNGRYRVDELAALAESRKLDVLVLTDSYLTTAEYGIWPFEHFSVEGLNRVVRQGVRDHGLDRYLAEVAGAQTRYPDLVIIPGVEVTPYYYWRGLPWKDLALHDFDRHLWIVGLGPEEIRNLPVIGNATLGNARVQWRFVALPAVLAAVGALLMFRRGPALVLLRSRMIARVRHRRAAGIGLMLLACLLTWIGWPFVRLYDPLAGRHDIRPYQTVIAYVRQHGGIIYWSYPEAAFGDVYQGGARMVSRPHPEDLLATDNYHGFEGLYGDNITATEPGGVWDVALRQYLERTRKSPPYVVSGIDFHYLREGGGWYELDGGLTMLLMPEKSDRAVLAALSQGRTYATFQPGPNKLRLEEFSVSTAEGAEGIQGSHLTALSRLAIHVRLDWARAAPPGSHLFRVELICNGKVIESASLPLPINLDIAQELEVGRYAYRVRARSTSLYQVLSNPIFVTVR